MSLEQVEVDDGCGKLQFWYFDGGSATLVV